MTTRLTAPDRIHGATSVYLDATRILAATVVFLVHANESATTGGIRVFWRASPFANDAVMVFFVLSGLVIAYVADRREHALRDYAVSRLARLYSVVLPALLLTIAADLIGSRLDPSPYAAAPRFPGMHPLVVLFDGIAFTGQLWFDQTQIWSNVPFWSLGYEAWYYVLFGIAFYIEGARKWVLLVIAAAIVGPKVLLLLPVWLMGVWTYHFIQRSTVSEAIGWLLLISSIALFTLYREFNMELRLRDLLVRLLGRPAVYEELTWSKWFLGSYLVGALVSLNFIGFAAVRERMAAVTEAIGPTVRRLAGFSFVTYLCHYPLLLLFAALYARFHGSVPRWWRAWIVLLPTIAALALLGRITEQQKGRYRWAFSTLLGITLGNWRPRTTP